MSELLKSALAYQERGLTVTPIAGGGKKPFVKSWQTTRLNTDELTHHFNNGHNVTGVGVVTGHLSGNLAILDFDGTDWLQAYEHFTHSWDEAVNRAPIVATGSGKRHIWVRCPDMPDSFTNEKFAHGNAVIELRGNRSQTLSPPSLHPSGNRYEWLTNEAEIPELDFNKLRQWLVEWGDKPQPANSKQRQTDTPAKKKGKLPPQTQEFLAAATWPEGDRNRALFLAAQQFAAARYTLEETIAQLEPVAARIGLEKKEILSTIKSGHKVGLKFTPIKEKGEYITSKDLLAALTKAGYTFRMSELMDKVEVNRKPITDAMRAQIHVKMRDAGLTRHLAAIDDVYLDVAFKNRYHPVKDYLNSLKWNDKPNIADLAAYFSDTDNTLCRYLTAWLVGSVAKVFKAEENFMLVLDGPQNLGKSQFVRWIGSPLPDFFIEGPIDPDGKDCIIRLATKWIWEVGELGATTRRVDREAFKLFITQRNVDVRPPYGRDSLVKPALASFIGTLNNEAGFLTDTTGNRRFWVCELTRIDWDYAKLDVNQVWAEAVHLYRTGYDRRLTELELQRRDAVHDLYRVESPVMGLFHKYFDFTIDLTSTRGQSKMYTVDILAFLEAHGLASTQQRANSMELSAGLKGLGIERSKGRPKGFYGVWQK